MRLRSGLPGLFALILFLIWTFFACEISSAQDLALVGEHDIETPVPQSYEYWHALKSMGVKTQLVVLAGEGHAIGQPAHKREVARRMVGWFNEYLKESAPRP